MSSKKQKDKYDQIIIETTVLNINVKTTGDLTTKEYDLIPFHPNMADLKDLSNNSYILFPSFVKITMKDLQKAGVGDNLPKVFMNLDKYIKLIKYVTSPEREEDYTLFIDKSQVKNYAMALAQNSLTDLISTETVDIIPIQKYEPLTPEEIITNNIELIKSIFCPIKSHFFILGNDYVIGQSKYVPPYKASVEYNEKLKAGGNIPLTYTVRFELQLLDAANNPGAGDFGKMSCKGKKNNIAKDAMDIFGTNFGYVPEKKASVPSILNASAATQNRQFGKLQKEWEERNKYVKAPTNERERLEMESKWTPLQRKMADFDKQQEEYNKIPPQWIKETDVLEQTYIDFKNDMLKLWQEVIAIVESNPTASTVRDDMIADVKTKMKATASRLVEKDTIADTLIDPLIEEITKIDKADQKGQVEAILTAKETFLLGANETTFVNSAKYAEQAKIDQKYIQPLLEDLKLPNKEKDLIELNSREKSLLARIKPNDTYGNKSIQVDLAKVQAEIRKKKGEIDMIKAKYGANGELKVIEWKKTKEKIKKLTDTLDQEKSKEEKKIKIESVNKELDKKLEEIVKLKKELALAKFFEGDYTELSKTDKESYEKKAMKDKPLDSVATIEENLRTAKEQYLDTAKNFSAYNRVQALITLLNNDSADFKKLKEAKKDEKDKKQTEIDKKNKTKLDIITAVDKKHAGNMTAEEKAGIETAEKEASIIQAEINEKILPIFERADEKYKLYNKYIDALKKLKQADADIGSRAKDITDKFQSLLTQLLDPETGVLETRNKIRLANDASKTTLNTELSELERKLKDNKAELKKDGKTESEINADSAITDLNDAITKKKDEITALTKKLDEAYKQYESKVNDAFPARSGGRGSRGKFLKKTRKRRQLKKSPKRYILTKNKIKKSARRRKKKYTLRHK